MDFEFLKELTEQHQYEEIKIIGRDAWWQGKRLHFIAMMRKGEETELCMLAEANKIKKEKAGRLMLMMAGQKAGDAKEGQNPAREHTNRQLMESCASASHLPNIKMLKIGDLVFESRGAQMGRLNIHDFDSLLLLAKLADAGWQLPEDSPFFKEDWQDEGIEMMRCRFNSPSESLPEWEGTEVVVSWNSDLRQHLIERQVRLAISDREDGQADEGCAAQIAFSIQDKEGGTQDGICYINKVSRIEPLAEEEKRFADPEYQKQVLEHMTPQEFEGFRQRACQSVEQACPRGMYFFVVEYECTLDLQLQFYTVEDLDSPPVRRSSAVSFFYSTNAEEETGLHGLRLRAAVIQSPVEADVKEVWAELFAAYETVPECEVLL